MHLSKYDCDSENTYKLLLKEKEICDKFVAERNNEINNWSQKIRYDKLKYYLKSENKIPISFRF